MIRNPENLTTAIIRENYYLKIYETATGDDAIPARAYLGCYQDDDTDHRILKGVKHEFADNTPHKCHRICYKQGFRYFGLADG